MGNAISSTKFGIGMCISECKDGFWLYSNCRGYNLSMRAKTAEMAYREALINYEAYYIKLKAEYNTLKSKVDVFLESLDDSEEDTLF